MRWPWPQRQQTTPLQLLKSVCAQCGFEAGTTADMDAALEALREHWAGCPRRKVKVSGKGGIWSWTHPGCESAHDDQWDWAQALRGAWLHVRSHDESLSDEESAQYACAARRVWRFL